MYEIRTLLFIHFYTSYLYQQKPFVRKSRTKRTSDWYQHSTEPNRIRSIIGEALHICFKREGALILLYCTGDGSLSKLSIYYLSILFVEVIMRKSWNSKCIFLTVDIIYVGRRMGVRTM